MCPGEYGCKLVHPGRQTGDTKGSKVATERPENLADAVYCPLQRRLLAMLYDGLVLLALLILAAAAALPFGDPDKVALRDFWFTLWLLLVCFAYLGGFWRYGGMTLGMRAWRIRLVGADGLAITWPRCLLRFVVGLVSLGAVGIGVLWALPDPVNRTWHDLAARTLLVKIANR